jgi:hypothetical protein
MRSLVKNRSASQKRIWRAQIGVAGGRSEIMRDTASPRLGWRWQERFAGKSFEGFCATRRGPSHRRASLRALKIAPCTLGLRKLGLRKSQASSKTRTADGAKHTGRPLLSRLAPLTSHQVALQAPRLLPLGAGFFCALARFPKRMASARLI